MNRAEIEQAVLKEIHTLPLDKVEATLNFVLSLKNQAVKKRPLGLLKDKVEFAIDENFKMTDEDFLHLKESSHANRTTVSNNNQ
ncbi:MAG: hypothetical protein Q8N96_04090 [Methylovulum sp.]|nr:hypothetical protein [Methylovulum sp.]